jgi:hypothetical protein
MVVGTGAGRDAMCRLRIASGGVVAETATATETLTELPVVAATVISTAIGAGGRRS